MVKRKICVITGTRAEYGLLYWLMREIEEDHEMDLQIIACGMHLSPEFGLTYQQIESDGFIINEKVEMLVSSDSAVGVSKSVALGLLGLTDAFQRLKPDLVVLLGDRFEILSAAQAAMFANIPIAHIHGGELTEGAIDDAIRHAITKMSHLHFVAASPYAKRVIQLGEQPNRVFNVGAPGLDHIRRTKLLTKKEFEQAIKFDLGELNFLVTYHPMTLSSSRAEDSLEQLLLALDQFPNAKMIFTKANADAEGRFINQIIDDYVQANEKRAILFSSLGQLRYLSALQYVDVVIGNSSSGLHEVPSFKKPSVNIGDRQKGRLKAKSVIDCRETFEEIVESIQIALSKSFKEGIAGVKSPYGEGNASLKIKEVLKDVQLTDLTKKSFYDVEFNQ